MMPTDNHTQDPALAEIKCAELLQAVDIGLDLTRNALTKKTLTVSDVESAMGFQRECAEKLGKLRLVLHGINVE